MQNRSVRIFLSSTFRDYGEERDLLVRKVFPNLRAKLKERFVELVDVDLRWGITVEQAERGEVLPICLAEIDRARPYFVGMLGDRYGWIPPYDSYAPDLIERQPWLDDHRGGKSVTELEMLHGVLNNPKMAGRALFYFRSSTYSRQKGGDYLPESSTDHERQKQLKARISKHSFPVMRYRDPEAFAKRMEKDLWKLLDKEFPATTIPDAFTREGLKHEAYAAPRRRLYLGGGKYIEALSLVVSKKYPKILIEGASGSGKSALLSNWLQSYRAHHPRHLIFEHYLGASTDSADPAVLVRRLIETIKRVTGSNEEIAGDHSKLYESIPTWLATASGYASKRKTQWVLAIDSLNSTTDLRDLRWLPDFIPPNLTLIVSSLDGEVKDALLTKVSNESNSKKLEKWHILKVKPLSSAERKNLVITYLAKYNKTLAPNLLKQALAHPFSNNPLFLKTLTEELRLFGVHEELQKRLKQYLTSKTIDDLFERVLKRVEEDSGKASVQHAMQAIWASRSGLTEKEILSITNLKPVSWATIRNALDECLLDSNGKISFSHDYMKIAVKDRYLKTKALQKEAHFELATYFQKKSVDARRVEEEPYQWREAKEWDMLKKCLIQRDIFEKLVDECGEDELNRYWLTLSEQAGMNCESSYKNVWKKWRVNTTDENLNITADKLQSFLTYAGFYNDFTIKLANLCVEYNLNKFGEMSVDTANALNNLATILRYSGSYQKAEQVQRRALKINEEVGKDSDIVISLINLANLLYDFGNYEDAKLLYIKGVSLQEKLSNLDQSDCIIPLNNLGCVYLDFEDYDQAELLFRKALKISERELGIFHSSTAGSIHNLGNLLTAKACNEDALHLYQRALKICKELLGPFHPQTALSMHSLGNALWKLDFYKDAEYFLLNSLAIYQRLFGQQHYSTANSLYNLGLFFQETGRCEEAEPLMVESLNIIIKIFKYDHPDAATYSYGLGQLFFDLEKYEKSEILLKDALRIRIDLFGPKSIQLAEIYFSLGQLLNSLGEFEEAEKIFLKEIEIYNIQENKDIQSLKESYRTVGMMFADASQYKKAMLYMETALNLGEELRKQSGEEINFELYVLGKLKFLEGEFIESEKLFLRCLEIEESLDAQEDMKRTKERLTELYQAWQKSEEVDKYKHN